MPGLKGLHQQVLSVLSTFTVGGSRRPVISGDGREIVIYDSDGTTVLGGVKPPRYIANFGTSVGPAVNDTTTGPFPTQWGCFVASWTVTFANVLDGDMTIELLLDGVSFPTPISTTVTAATGSTHLHFTVAAANRQAMTSGQQLTAHLSGLTATNAVDVGVVALIEEY